MKLPHPNLQYLHGDLCIIILTNPFRTVWRLEKVAVYAQESLGLWESLREFLYNIVVENDSLISQFVDSTSFTCVDIYINFGFIFYTISIATIIELTKTVRCSRCGSLRKCVNTPKTD